MDRITYLDSLRGFAILLVIIGHMVQFNYLNGIESPIFNIIYSFHMPLFFFLSGCTTFLSEHGKCSRITVVESVRQIKKKFLSLIVPSVCWTIIVPLFFSSKYVFDKGISFFWFLNTLFAISVIWIVRCYISSVFNRRIVVDVILLLILAGLFFIGFKRVSLMYLMMFIIGYVFQKNNLLNRINDYIYFILLMIFCLGVGFFRYTENGIETENRIWLEIPFSICASFCLVKAFSMFKQNIITDKLTFIGKYTLGIYLCHFIFIHGFPISGIQQSFNDFTQFVILLAVAFVVAVLCVLIQRITESFPLLNKLMYGSFGK